MLPQHILALNEAHHALLLVHGMSSFVRIRCISRISTTHRAHHLQLSHQVPQDPWIIQERRIKAICYRHMKWMPWIASTILGSTCLSQWSKKYPIAGRRLQEATECFSKPSTISSRSLRLTVMCYAVSKESLISRATESGVSLSTHLLPNHRDKGAKAVQVRGVVEIH